MKEWQGEHAAVKRRWQSTIQGMEEYQVFNKEQEITTDAS
jgi:hypothetical protein